MGESDHFSSLAPSASVLGSKVNFSSCLVHACLIKNGIPVMAVFENIEPARVNLSSTPIEIISTFNRNV